MDLRDTVGEFKSQTGASERYASFDYCYNYFSQTEDLTADMEKSCLNLAFYLASWGMLRGSSFLLQKSARHYVPLVEYINDLDRSVWKIDAHSYSEENIEKVLVVYAGIREKLIGNKDTTHLTLVTKTALGVFGFIPAFDQYFVKTFKELFKKDGCGFTVVNKNSLNCIRIFYEANKEEIDTFASSTFTRDFSSGDTTKINYTRAKIIDMYGFTAGLNS